MTNEELITVVVPIYHVEKYLDDCLTSIVEQTYSNIEIILIPQPGGDECETICRKYEQKDNRVSVYPQTICDLSHARNVGILKASGQIVSFVDSDDIIDRRFIEKLYNLMKDKNADIVQCASYAFIDKEAIVQKVDRNYIDEYTGVEMCYTLPVCKYGSDSGVIQTKLYKATLFEKIRFPEGRLNEDGAVNYKLYWNSSKVVVTGEKLYFYRSQREDSIIHTVSNRLCEDSLITAKECFEFYCEKGNRYLSDYAAYTYGNALIRARLYIKNQEDNLNSWRETQSQILITICQSEYISILKKIIARIGYISPTIWGFIWSMRKKIREIIEWKIKGEKK